jgi:hypothetical protein
MALSANKLSIGGPLEIFGDDGTLFTAHYDAAAAGYMVVSRTPIDGHEPLVLKQFVARADATRFREQNWVDGYSIDTAGLQIGMETLKAKIPGELRRFKNGLLVEEELEQVEGFASF